MKPNPSVSLPLFRIVWALVCALVWISAASPASAAEHDFRPPSLLRGRMSGRIELRAPAGSGPIELQPTGDVFEGTFQIHNAGDGALDVTRIFVRTSPNDPRAPAGLRVAFEDDRVSAHLAAGETRTAKVTWIPAASSAREVYAHIVAESSSNDHLPAAMGVHAELGGRGAWLARHALSLLTFLPLAGFVIVLIAYFAGLKDDRALRWTTLAVMGVNLALAVWVYLHFNLVMSKADGNDGYQFIERAIWIRSLHVEYFVGIDGISITMVLLTALISFVGVLASFSIEKQLKGYFAMYCLLVTGMMGVFVALDLFLFYVFWEVMLLPMYFLIGIWGGPRKEYAAIKFFLYTLAGSVFMLLAFIALHYNADPTYLSDGTYVTRTFSIPDIGRVDFAGKNLAIAGLSFTRVVWVALFVAFAIKIPMFPFHTWLPDAHVEAPTAISVILAGVLLKMGTYGILRINFGLLPEATSWAAPTMAAFGTINILYGALCAMAQSDLKKLVAYSSVSHMGYCLLAMASLTPVGIQACLVQMFNHGTITAMLFTCVGVLYDRAHTRDLGRFGGLAKEMPLYTAFVGFAFMASLGLPGLSGFIGEVLTFLGAFPVFRGMTILAASGVILTAAYHLWALQRMFLGSFREDWRTSHALEPFGGKFPEIRAREIATLVPLAALVLLFGFWPKPLLSLTDRGVQDLWSAVSPAGPSQIARGGR